MTVYTTDYSEQAKLLKRKLRQNGIAFTICKDQDVMEEKKIKTVPMLELNDGTMLNFQNAMKRLEKELCSIGSSKTGWTESAV